MDVELRLGHGALRLSTEAPADDLADLAELLADAARADADSIGVPARDVLIVFAESTAAVLAASLRALDDMEPEPGPAALALAATYERHTAGLAEIEAAYRDGAASPVM